MLGEIVPKGSSRTISTRAPPLDCEKARGEKLRTKANPLTAAEVRRKSRRRIISMLLRFSRMQYGKRLLGCAPVCRRRAIGYAVCSYCVQSVNINCGECE